MTPEITHKVKQAAVFLRQGDRQNWDNFLAALKERSDAVIQQCISSSPEDLRRLQGQAQEARELVRLLSNAFADIEQLRMKETTRAKPPQGS